MACNLISPMYEKGAVGARFSIASIKSSAALVAASLLDTPVILLYSGRSFTVSEMCSSMFLLTYTVWNL